jgi:soluble lytic murein transglycosylase-like protein
LVCILAFAVPSCLWSQAAFSSNETPESNGRPFDGIDKSLNKVADTLLASANHTTPADLVKSAGNSPTNTLVLDPKQPARPSVGSGQSAAAMRVNLLRPSVDPILRSYGVPDDLSAVILVESGGRASALSPKGARGLWQLMPDTARRYGLRVDDAQDDRLDLFRATDAAARYLHDLYGQFGDWKLALAAYNTGEVNVGAAIIRAHSQDFDQLARLQLLPLETRNYVPRVLATAELFGRSSIHGETRSPANAGTIYAVSNP